jgi:hypothetical protein
MESFNYFTMMAVRRLEELAELDCFRCGETQKAFSDFLKRNKR